MLRAAVRHPPAVLDWGGIPMRFRIAGPAFVAIAALALVGCSGSTAGTASAGAGASTAVAASGAPTTAVTPGASEAAPSEAAASEAVPSFAFPSTDKELEALLPATLCGKTVQKLSIGGEMFSSAADPEFQAVLQRLGKSASDVSFAVATPAASGGGCSAGIFRIKGADGGALKDAFLAEAAKEGSKFEVKSIGGKDVYVDPTSDSYQYVYFKGDAVVFAGAPSESDAATIIAVLP
jgi:hypothetical protein